MFLFWIVKKGYEDILRIFKELRNYMEKNREISEEDTIFEIRK